MFKKIILACAFFSTTAGAQSVPDLSAPQQYLELLRCQLRLQPGHSLAQDCPEVTLSRNPMLVRWMQARQDAQNQGQPLPLLFAEHLRNIEFQCSGLPQSEPLVASARAGLRDICSTLWPRTYSSRSFFFDLFVLEQTLRQRVAQNLARFLSGTDSNYINSPCLISTQNAVSALGSALQGTSTVTRGSLQQLIETERRLGLYRATPENPY